MVWMSSRSVALSVGLQLPRVSLVPEFSESTGVEVVDLCAEVGLDLDPWQQHVIVNAMGERASDQKWAAFEVGVVVPRQNGKGGIIEARTLGGLYLLSERLLVHSAHQFDTSLEAFHRLLAIVEGNDWLSRRVKKVSRSHGEEGITLTNGQRVRFRTRTKGGGRGFTCDCLFIDEAMILPTASKGALVPTLSAVPNPQVWYLGSAVDQDVHEHGVEFSRVRSRGCAGEDRSLAYFEWSVPGEVHEISEQVATDPQSWAQANPALGIRISEEHVAREQASLAHRTFAVERLGVGDWPDPSDAGEHVIDPEMWRRRTDVESRIVGQPCIAFDVTPDRERGVYRGGGAPRGWSRAR
jgi:phage terminase large subunit-like protein